MDRTYLTSDWLKIVIVANFPRYIFILLKLSLPWIPLAKDVFPIRNFVLRNLVPDPFKSLAILILGRAGQNYLQKCPSMTKFLHICHTGTTVEKNSDMCRNLRLNMQIIHFYEEKSIMVGTGKLYILAETVYILCG